MIAIKDVDRIIGLEAVDPDNDRVGTVHRIHLDAGTGRPRWAAIRSEQLGGVESLVPLDHAAWDPHTLHVAFGRDRIMRGPLIGADHEPSAQEQRQLCRYYGLDGAPDDDATWHPARGTEPAGGSMPDAPHTARQKRAANAAARGGSGPGMSRPSDSRTPGSVQRDEPDRMMPERDRRAGVPESDNPARG